MAEPTPDPGRNSVPATGAEGKSDRAPDIAPDSAQRTHPDNAAKDTPDNAPGSPLDSAPDGAPDDAFDTVVDYTAGNIPRSSTCHAPPGAQSASPSHLPGKATDLATKLALFLEGAPDVILVRLTRVQGSAPRGQGTTMCISATGLCGTIGGGQLEYMAIDQARALLVQGGARTEMDVPLGPEIGQCCGGRVTLSLKRMDAADRADQLQEEHDARAVYPHVYLYGAGHVGRALARAFAPLPLRLLLVDSRETELSLCSTNIKTCLTPLPESVLRAAPAGAAHIIATHDHALDFLLTSEALARQDAAYVGLIGSKTKRARFLRWHAEQAPEVPTKALICPIGGHAVPDKRPEVIAALVVAEVLQALAVWARVTAEV